MFFCFTLRKSSKKPTSANAAVASSAGSASSVALSENASVPTSMPAMNIMPPIVGVPALLRWLCGPSLRSFWPNFNLLSIGIITGPSAIVTTAETIKAYIAYFILFLR